MPEEKFEDTSHWYVLWTNPKQEDRAANNLRAWGVETLNPKFRQSRFDERNQKLNREIKCLFPRYIFARFSANRMLNKVRFTRGVQSVVSFGGSPTPVDDEVVTIIRHRTGVDGLIRVGDEPSPGDVVTVKHGPWKNLIAIFERETKDSDRVSILLTTVGYKARLEIDRSLIEKLPELNQTCNG